MSKAIAICRVSSPRQEENNHSLTHQISSVTKMAVTLDVDIVKTWSMAVSSRRGKNLKREDLKQAKQLCKHDRSIKYILLDKVNRLGREAKYLTHYILDLEINFGVRLIFCDPSQSELNEADNPKAFLKTVEKLVEGEIENEERINTTTAKMKYRVSIGYYPFYPHQGYKKTDLADGLHIPDYPRFTLLQTALKACAKFEMTPEDAVRWLNVNGYRTPTILRKNKAGVRVQCGGRKLDIDHFRTIMQDPYYAGILNIKGWEINEHGLHKPMITVEDFEINTSIATNRKKRIKQQFNPAFRMNKAWHEPCQQRDGKITGINHTNGKGWWREEYVCRECKKRIPKKLVHEAVDNILERTKPSQEAIKALSAALDKVWLNNEEYRIQRSNELTLRKDTLKTKKSDLITALTVNPELADDFKVEIQRVKLQISEADMQLAEVNNVNEDYREFMTYALSYIENLRGKWWELPKKSFEKCKHLLFNDEFLVAQDGEVYTPKLSPIYTLLNKNDDPKVVENGNMVELVGTAPTSAGLSWLIVYRLRSFRKSRGLAGK